MRFTFVVVRLVALSLGWACAAAAVANEETQLVDSINAYRNQAQSCRGQASLELPPLKTDARLVLSATSIDGLQDALARTSYPMVNVQAISLSGPRDADTAMQAVLESFCQVVLDPQFVDIGISREARNWRIVLARPLLSRNLGTSQADGQKVLELVNAARAQPRQCAGQAFSSAQPLEWNLTLAGAAEGHARDMANNNYFDHKDREGRTPGDRAELAGYGATEIGENIAAGRDAAAEVVDGWLASPGHCANLMNPGFKEMGAAHAVDPRSDAGVYWTAMFGAQ